MLLHSYNLTYKNVCILIFILILSLPVDAQVTTSSLDGRVTDGEEPLIGATIRVLHDESGTEYACITNTKGYFSLSGLRIGGSYTVEASYIGHQRVVIHDIRLKLSETYQLNIVMQPSTLLDEVVISGKKNTSPETRQER